MIRNVITQKLADDTIQRISYFIALVLWIGIWVNNAAFYHTENLFGIRYTWFMLVPVLLLLSQVAFNKRITWVFIWILIGSYTVWAIYCILLFIAIDQSRYYVHAVYWTAGESWSLSFPILILLVMNWMMFKLKPHKVTDSSN